MKTKRLIIASVLFTACLQASATDVYVYLDGNFTPVASLENIRKIITGDSLTTLISAKGDSAAVENEAFSYITFHRTSVPVGIGTTETQKPTISYENGVVRVCNAAKIRRVELITSDGAVFAKISPTSSDFVLSTHGIPAGVYVINATTTDGQRISKKFIKK